MMAASRTARVLLFAAFILSAGYLLVTLVVVGQGAVSAAWYTGGALAYGVVIVLVLVALLFEQRPEERVRHTRFPVEGNPLTAIPEIGAGEIEALRLRGVSLTDELLHADLRRLAREAQIPQDRLARWRDISELMAINGVGPTWSVRLVDAGVRNLRQLASTPPDRIAETLLRAYRETGADARQVALQARTLPAAASRLVDAAQRAVAAL